VVDFAVLKALMLEVIYERFDHRHINEVAPFDEINPSAENLALHFAEEIATRLDDERIRVSECRVWETTANCAVYRR
jgi:6-pyruvoyltetrahydropterin/6-carboxytetrahydropterin synthase